jgi:ABC-type uncharacterized transport system YnjBCD ATPase subunit
MLLALLVFSAGNLAQAAQVVGEVTLTIGKSQIDRAAGAAEAQKGALFKKAMSFARLTMGMFISVLSMALVSASDLLRFFAFTNSSTALQTQPPLWFA